MVSVRFRSVNFLRGGQTGAAGGLEKDVENAPQLFPWTGWGMRAGSEIASTLDPEEEIPLLGSSAQGKGLGGEEE